MNDREIVMEAVVDKYIEKYEECGKIEKVLIEI